MKWGRKKSNASSSGHSLISHVLPNSWLTKFKQMSIKPGKKQPKANQKGKWNSGSVSSPRLSNCGEAAGGGARFYGGDGDAFWRLSFGDYGVDDSGKNKEVIRPVRYNSSNETEFPPSNYHACRLIASRTDGKVDTKKFKSMASRARKMGGTQTENDDDDHHLPTTYTCMRETKAAEIRTPRMKIEGEEMLRKRSQRVFEEKQLELNGEAITSDTEEAVKSGIAEGEDCRFPSYVSSMNSKEFYSKNSEECSLVVDEDESGGSSVENLSSKWQSLKEMKIEEVKSRSEKQRKSLHISRELQRRRPKQNSRARECSPRTASRVEICKVKALEDMKMKMMKKKEKKKKKKTKGKAKEEKSMEDGLMGLESFAVVKVSMDPQKDFRDSMVEMIQEKRISRPEEFEELLACYLTLNSDEYHHLIIKVFRQVWFDLNQACLDPELQDDQCHYDY